MNKREHFVPPHFGTFCGARVGNAGVLLQAQREQLALDTAKTAAVKRRIEIQEEAVTDKDWGDVIQWVLLAAGVSFLVNNHKERCNHCKVRDIGTSVDVLHSAFG